MNDPDQAVTFSVPDSKGLPEDPWTDDKLKADQGQPTIEPAAAFTSGGFIAAALKRGAWVWCATAVLGLVIGYGLYVKFPPAYAATTSVLLTENPTQGPSQIQTDASLAQSTGVAADVVNQLGLRETPSGFIASYTVTPVGNQVLTFTVGAPSSADAVRRASALATDFLQFRGQMLDAQQQLQSTVLDQQTSQLQQQLDSINSRISQISASSTSAGDQATLSRLREQLTATSNALASDKVQESTTQLNTATMVKDSVVINVAAPVAHKFKQSKSFYLAIALIAGLAIGMGIVIVGALVSDRLRTRNDVAGAIGAPVRLSVGPLSGRGGVPGLGTRARRRALDERRLSAHLSGAVRLNSRGPGGLAVVAVENADVAARAVVSLAVHHASQGKRVVVADLSSGIYAARLLGVKDPGVRAVKAKGADLVVSVPARDDVAPTGPVASMTGQAGPAQVSEPLAAAYESASLLVTIATLDPAAGGDHLATWATDAVVMVTAGRSSATRIHATGEMIRLAGVHLASVVLVGADKSDESLGVPQSADQSSPVMPV